MLIPETTVSPNAPNPREIIDLEVSNLRLLIWGVYEAKRCKGHRKKQCK